MEPPCTLISWVNPFPRRFINRTTFFCNAWIAWMRLLPAVWSKTILLSFLYFHWLFPPQETVLFGKGLTTLERVDSNGMYGRWRLHLMGSWFLWLVMTLPWESHPGKFDLKIKRSMITPWSEYSGVAYSCSSALVSGSDYTQSLCYLHNYMDWVKLLRRQKLCLCYKN